MPLVTPCKGFKRDQLSCPTSPLARASNEINFHALGHPMQGLQTRLWWVKAARKCIFLTSKSLFLGKIENRHIWNWKTTKWSLMGSCLEWPWTRRAEVMLDCGAWLLPVEQLAVERRQVTGHRTGHGQPAAFSDLDRLRRSGWCGAASRYNTELILCHTRSATDIQRTRNCSGQVM